MAWDFFSHQKMRCARLFWHSSIRMWNNVDDWWTICGSKNRSTRPLGRCGQFLEKSVIKNFLREKESEILSTSPQSHTAQPLRPFPGRGTALRNISDPRRLPCYGITEAICQGCAGTAQSGFALDEWFRLCKLAIRRRGMKDPSSLGTESRSVIGFWIYRELYHSLRATASVLQKKSTLVVSSGWIFHQLPVW